MDNQNENVFRQDLHAEAEHIGAVFVIHLLMNEKCDMPSRERMQEVMSRHISGAECYTYDGQIAGFAANKYSVHYEKDNCDVPPQLMITECSPIEQPILNDSEKNQLWSCKDGAEILEDASYQVFATDMLAAGLKHKERAELLVDFVEALMELYPSCTAVVFETSKKMFTREQILYCDFPKELRFIYYAVNVRFFKIQDTEDMLVDSVGMSPLFLPDVQYHFCGIDHDEVINHAYNLLAYIYENNNPFETNDRIDGIKNGELSSEVQWTVRYENAIVQPERTILDVNMGAYAAGIRED